MRQNSSPGLSAQSCVLSQSSPQLGQEQPKASSGLSHPWFQSQMPTEDTRRAGKCCPQLYILQGRRETSQQRGLAWTTHHFRWKGRTRDRWLFVVRPGVGRRGCTCSPCFSFQPHWLRQPAKETQTHALAKGEDTDSTHCHSAAQHQPSLRHTGELATTPAPFLQARKICSQWQQGVSTPPTQIHLAL